MKIVKLSAITLLILFSLVLFAQDDAQEDDTRQLKSFIGASVSVMAGSVKYKAFRSSSYAETDEKTTSITPSITAQLYGPFLMGEFTAGCNTESSSEKKLNHINASFSGSVRYLHTLNEHFAFFAGPGFYVETWPSSKSYDGGGWGLWVGSVYSANDYWKISLAAAATYGKYGAGNDSTKLGYGINLAVTRKFGHF